MAMNFMNLANLTSLGASGPASAPRAARQAGANSDYQQAHSLAQEPAIAPAPRQRGREQPREAATAPEAEKKPESAASSAPEKPQSSNDKESVAPSEQAPGAASDDQREPTAEKETSSESLLEQTDAPAVAQEAPAELSAAQAQALEQLRAFTQQRLGQFAGAALTSGAALAGGFARQGATSSAVVSLRELAVLQTAVGSLEDKPAVVTQSHKDARLGTKHAENLTAQSEGKQMPAALASLLTAPKGGAFNEKLLAALQGGGRTTSAGAELSQLMQLNVQGLQVKPMAYQWAPAHLEGSSPAQWGQQLIALLRDKVQLQVNQQVKQAHIRLDPPDLGRLDLSVKVEGDKLTVQLNANNPAVREALLQNLDRLRSTLSTHHSGGVEVNVGQGERDPRQAQWQTDKILAGRRESAEADGAIEKRTSGWLDAVV
ncbi:MAG: flagellar hook-length control protein FliK [Aeromonas sp.]